MVAAASGLGVRLGPLGSLEDGREMGVEPRQNAVENRAYHRQSGRRSPVRIDYRTRVGSRARLLSQHFSEAITASGRELSVELVVAIDKAGELVALAEDLRARMLRAEPGANADDLVRLQRLADASVRRLSLPTSANKRTPSLAEYLATARAADEAVEP